jgi:hypothetical protein
MADIERQVNGGGGPNIIEKMARFLLGQLSKEDMDEANRETLSYYLELMDHNPKLKEIVYAKKNEIILANNDGRKIPLFTAEELAKAKRQRKKKIPKPGRDPRGGSQIALFESEEPIVEPSEVIMVPDPEQGLAKLHKIQQSPFTWNKNKIIGDEIRQKRLELRDRIGLPIARGKSEHVNDRFYKYLVRRVVTFDNFGVFSEYDRVIRDTPPELDLKINEVKGLVTELLSGVFNQRERFQRFDRFSRGYTEKWGQ